ncbi:MAG: hypothetical protein HYY16_19055 [Planctomycetes bacterium]|nr:hypothetical protein [Planctomycetota bacterium]
MRHPVRPSVWRALGAGLVAGLAVSFLAGLAPTRAQAMLEPLWIPTAPSGTGFIRPLIYLAASAAIAFLYACAMEAVRRADWRVGVLLSVPHLIAAGTAALVLAPSRAPSAFDPMSLLGLLFAHVLYGAIVGRVYRLRSRPRTDPRRGKLRSCAPLGAMRCPDADRR